MQTSEKRRRTAPASSPSPRSGPSWQPRGGFISVQLAVLSAAVGAIHIAVAGAHFDYYWLHGAFFVGAGLAQVAWAGLVLAYPVAPVYLAGALGNSFVVATWAMSRTIGTPFGPEPWVPEPISTIDLLATAFEMLVIAGALYVLRRVDNFSPRAVSLGRLVAFGGVVLALTGGAIVRDGITGHVHGGLGELGLMADGHGHPGTPIAPGDPILLQLEDAVREGGAVAGMDLLEQRAVTDPGVQRLAHQYVHSLARLHYDLSPDAATAFSTCDDRFEGGCYHGVLQRYFEENPGFTGQTVASLCGDLGTEQDINLKWQCLHGLGHGLTLYFDHNLLRPLRYCDFLGAEWDRRSCYGGVFMENVVWSQNVQGARATGEGVLDEDLHYPCNAIDDRYRPDCWLMQTSTILRLVGWDLARAFQTCNNAERAYIPLCYDGMGREIASYTGHDPLEAGRLCLTGAEAWQGGCFSGAAKQLVDYHGGTDQAFAMCSTAPADARLQCYRSMGEMIHFYWSGDDQRRREECAKAEDPVWIQTCEAAAQAGT
jgi:hypothetical protein